MKADCRGDGVWPRPSQPVFRRTRCNFPSFDLEGGSVMNSTFRPEHDRVAHDTRRGVSDEVRIIVIHKTVQQSWLRDASTLALIVTVIGTGWALGSEAMQWCGFVLLALNCIARARSDRLTPQQAAERLYADYGVQASDAQSVGEQGVGRA